MRFLSLSFYNFRNIVTPKINTEADDIVLSGVNGQGKTNILEAIYTLCYGASFRTQKNTEMITYQANEMRIAAEVIDDYMEKHTISYTIQNGKRTILFDGKEIRDRKEIIYLFPCIVYSHEDIDFIKGEPANRRRFFDQMMSLYNPVFLDDNRRYHAVLLQRNAAIKTQRYNLLPIYNQKLAYYGISIMEERKKTIEEFNQIYPDLYKQISGTDKKISIDYRPSWKENSTIDDILATLEENTEKDLRLFTTTSGIHRDRFIITDEHGAFAVSGSTGQLRLASLLLRVAEGRFFTQKTGKKPLLLLDDVLLELDSGKRAAFLASLDNYSQAFYTFLPKEHYFDERKEIALSYVLKEGNIEIS